MPEPASPVNALILTLHLCERVIHDRQTNQISLIQLIDNVNAPEFPVAVPAWFLYTEIIGCHGAVTLALRIVDVDEAFKPVCEHNMQFQQLDPLKLERFISPLPALVFPREGEYRIQVTSGDGPPFEKRLTVRKSVPPKQEID